MKKISIALVAVVLSTATLFGSDVYLSDNSKVPNLKMKDTGLSFKDIEGYQNYKIVATHQKKIKKVLDTMEFKIKGYNCGVDDYIAKPFSARELAIKIKSLLKRKEELVCLKDKSLCDIILKEEAKEVLVDGFKIEFTPSEYTILSVLINNKNRVFSRADLAQIIYDNDLGEIDEQGINSHIYHIKEEK